MSRSKSLQYYILVRLMLVPLMLLTITTVVFLLLRATPGDPVDAVLGVRAPESVKQEYRLRLGLLDPLWLQYVRYLGSLLRLDLGTSITSQGEVVWDTIKQYFPATVELAVFSMATALIVGITVGAISASRPNSWLDVGGRLFGIITYALPLFWVGMLVQLVFSVQLGWFPLGSRFPVSSATPVGFTGLYTIDSLIKGDLSSFFTALYYLCLPSLTLGVLLSGIFERIVRVNLKQTLRADYIEAARARGISERQILISHALKKCPNSCNYNFGINLCLFTRGSGANGGNVFLARISKSTLRSDFPARLPHSTGNISIFCHDSSAC